MTDTTTTTLELLREAMAAIRENDLPRTRVLLQEATLRDPRNETAWLWLANVAETLVEAATALEKVATINPNNEKARAALKEVRLPAGVSAAKAKDVVTAKRLLRGAVADDPNCEQGWFWLASVTEAPREALAHLQRVVAINPGNAAAHKGIAYYQNKIAKLYGDQPSGRMSGVVPASVSTRTPMPMPKSGAVQNSGRFSAPARDVPLKTVLVIDASRTNRKLVGLTLLGEGYGLVEAADALEAADHIREDGAPDLIVMDGLIPGGKTSEFCQLLRQNPVTREVPILLLGGKEGLLDQLRGVTHGVDQFLPKPLQPETLVRAARDFVPAEPSYIG